MAAVVGASTKANPDKVAERLGPTVGAAVKGAQENAWWIIPVALLAIPALDWLRRRIGDDRVWRIVRDVLDQFREDLFSDAIDDQVHAHRVTLFKHVTWHWCRQRWPWSGWLVPVERSGHTTQRTDIAFLAPDDADRVQGVAGMTWSRNQVVSVKDLAVLEEPDLEGKICDYAKRTWVSPDAVRARMPRARSLVGIPVEVKNQLWGVIVVDSRDSAISQRRLKKTYKLVAGFLGKTLEGL